MGFSQNFVESFVSSIFTEIASILIQEASINIPKIGTFQIHQKTSRPGMDINKNQKVIITPRKVIRFIPSRSLKEVLNAKS
ncbi:MAG UNVERIFIED_CONTAM: HU family DNA-binding protein [Rickettsiaceae bacterium]